MQGLWLLELDLPSKRKHWGKSVSVDLYRCNHALITSKEEIGNFVIKLCNLIDVVRYGETKIVHFGRGRVEGYSMIQLIETSLVSGHFANEDCSAYIDVFSCKDFSKDDVGGFSKDFFGAKEMIVYEQIRR